MQQIRFSEWARATALGNAFMMILMGFVGTFYPVDRARNLDQPSFGVFSLITGIIIITCEAPAPLVGALSEKIPYPVRGLVHLGIMVPLWMIPPTNLCALGEIAVAAMWLYAAFFNGESIDNVPKGRGE